jgi:uncharacterized coiled-coil DUF342 family protein
MNEQRIRELAEQASTHAEETVHVYTGQRDGVRWEAKILKARDLKFAELIVKECSKAVLSVAPQYTDYRSQIEEAVIQDCSLSVLEHFEVKECEHRGYDLLFLREEAVYNYYRCRNCHEEVKMSK